jgi:hypothetical protein
VVEEIGNAGVTTPAESCLCRACGFRHCWRAGISSRSADRSTTRSSSMRRTASRFRSRSAGLIRACAGLSRARLH